MIKDTLKIKGTKLVPVKERPINIAKSFIINYVGKKNEINAYDIETAAAKENIHIDTLIRARDALGITSKQHYRRWTWVLNRSLDEYIITDQKMDGDSYE